MALKEMEKEVKKLGFENLTPHLQLEVEDRNIKRSNLIQKLRNLGLERKKTKLPKNTSSR